MLRGGGIILVVVLARSIWRAWRGHTDEPWW
jgi:hypothetical protein